MYAFPPVFISVVGHRTMLLIVWSLMTIVRVTVFAAAVFTVFAAAVFLRAR